MKVLQETVMFVTLNTLLIRYIQNTLPCQVAIYKFTVFVTTLLLTQKGLRSFHNHSVVIYKTYYYF